MTKKQLQDELAALDSQHQRLIVENGQLWEEAKKQEKYANIDFQAFRKAKQTSLRYQICATVLLGTWLVALVYWLIT